MQARMIHYALARISQKSKNGDSNRFQPSSQGAVLRIEPNLSNKIALTLASLLLCFALGLHGQDKGTDTTGKSDSAAKDSRFTIVVTGGDDKKPVDSASVYVRFVEEHKHGRDKKIEMNLKTNLSGVCHVPILPPGKFLIQVIAEGWKTFGEYYDISETEQTIHVQLVRPPKWY
jgi:hypothetical protein